MRITYQSENYAPEKIVKRYVRFGVNGVYQFCEVGSDKRYDLRQGEVNEIEIPEDIKEKAIALRGQAFAYVEWPF